MTDRDRENLVQTPDALRDPERLAALRRADLLDTPPEERFDRLTRLVTSILGVPVALVSLVDEGRQFFKSQQGLPEPYATSRETGLSHSFCQHVVSSAAPLVVSDARKDPLVRDNLAISDIGVVAYAGVPITDRDGQVIGSFCAIDTKPREWTAAELDTLRQLGALIRTELELRDALRDADAAAVAAGRASAERIAVIDSSSDGIYTVDMSGACTLVNPAASRILGYAPDEFIAQNMHELVHHHFADGRLFPEKDCPLYLAFRDGHTVRLENTSLWRKDGSRLPADCTSSPLLIDGVLTGAVMTFRDVSEREMAAAALRDSEIKFRAIFEDAGVGIAILTPTGQLLDCNESYERITGYPRQALRGMTFAGYTHPDDVEHEWALARELLSGVSPRLQMAKRYVRKDGGIVWGQLNATTVRTDDGNVRFVIGVVEDITAQRRAADAMRMLAEAGALLASSLEYETTVMGAARLALPILGDACIVDLHRPEGLDDAICVHIDRAREPKLCELHQRSVAAGGAAAADAAIDGALGGLPVASPTDFAALGLHHVLTVPLPGREQPLGRLTFASERKMYGDDELRLAEELARRAASAIENARLYREAQSATRARDEVLGVVSHDLRNPVHTIMMSTSFLLEIAPNEDSGIQNQLGAIRRSAQRADRLIRDLLDVTRVENGQLRLERGIVAVPELLAEAVQLVTSQAERGDIHVELIAGDPSLRVDSDRDRTLQALDNLLGNAIKFTPRGGRVSLEAVALDGGVEFIVRDTGSGITPEQQANLFRRFWQARRADRRGVGLGLTIVKGIVDAHGGSIRVESDGRTGTTFRFTIPAPPSAAREESRTTGREALAASASATAGSDR